LPINGNEEYVISSYVLGSFFKNQVVVAAWICIMFHLYSCLFLCMYHAVFMSMALYYSLKWGIVTHPAILFLLNIALAIYSLFCFHMNFKVDFSKLCVHSPKNFDKNCIKHVLF
jgi:hypothetical protein